jgi:acetylornithine deacetylase/succinyl-diaminopimelate desuccinylase-like protein
VDTTITHRVLAQLNEREIVDLAGNLIRIPSFCPDETPVARFLAAYFEERGYQVDLQEVEPGRFQTIGTLRGAGAAGASCSTATWTSIR